MAYLITPTTELEAVNECLENIGQAPVSSISGDLGVDAQMALNVVRRVNRELQSQGWQWNTDINFTLKVNSNGDILLPTGTLAVDSDGVDRGRDVVQRGPLLYDRINHTFQFTEDITVTITIALAFEDLVETARRYIAMRAARIFQNRVEGREDNSDLRDEQAAMAILMADEMRSEDNNMLTDNWSTAGTIRRHAFGYVKRT
jgi:hypothetical protein